MALRLPAHLPLAEIIVKGRGGAPRVAVRGPGGAGLEDPSDQRPAVSVPIVISPLPRTDETVIALNHPRGGRWRVFALPGSAAITAVEHLDGLPSARVSARVLGRGRRRALLYRVRPRDGQRVEFIERSGQVYHPLGVARAARGRLRFQAADGPGGRRRILALITLAGVPAQQLTVATFTAPPRERPGRVRRLRVRRTADGALRISWGAASGPVRGYLVGVTLSDGRRLALPEPLQRRRLLVRPVVASLRGEVTVRALGVAGTVGPAVTVAVRPLPAPGRVRGLRARRLAHGVLVSWRRAARARLYLVTVSLPGSHRYAAPLLTTATRFLSRLTLPRLRRGEVALVTVRAVGPTGALGAPARLRYRRGGARASARQHPPA